MLVALSPFRKLFLRLTDPTKTECDSWNGFVWLRIGSSGGILWTAANYYGLFVEDFITWSNLQCDQQRLRYCCTKPRTEVNRFSVLEPRPKGYVRNDSGRH